MVQIGGYVKRYQEEDTKELAALTVSTSHLNDSWRKFSCANTNCPLWDFWRKKTCEPFADLNNNKIALLTFRMLWNIYNIDTSA